MATNSKDKQREYDAKRAGQRTRSWACIVYPESAPPDWMERLNEAHIETLISPLHDLDVTAEGEVKKAHYHVLALYPNPVPENAAAEYFARAGVTAPAEMVKNAKGYARYLVHMDDHDKFRYREQDVKGLAGAIWECVALDDADQVNAFLDEIEDFIAEQGCISYYALCRYARTSRPEWTHIIRTHTIHLSALVKSLEWEQDKAARK